MIRICLILLITIFSVNSGIAQDGYYVKMVKAASGDPDKLQGLTRVLTEADRSSDPDTTKWSRRAWKQLAFELGAIRYYRPAYLALDHFIELKNKAHDNDKDQVITDESDKMENLLAEAMEEEQALLSKTTSLERELSERKNNEGNLQLISILITVTLLLSALIFLFISLKRAMAYKSEASLLREQLSENLITSVVGKMSSRLKKSTRKSLIELNGLSDWFTSKEPVLEEQLTGKTIASIKELVEKAEAVSITLSEPNVSSSHQE